MFIFYMMFKCHISVYVLTHAVRIEYVFSLSILNYFYLK